MSPEEAVREACHHFCGYAAKKGRHDPACAAIRSLAIKVAMVEQILTVWESTPPGGPGEYRYAAAFLRNAMESA